MVEAINMKQKYLLRTNVLYDFADLVKSLGGNVDSLLNKVGFTQQELADKTIQISYKSFVRLIDFAAIELNSPTFGLLLSTSINLDIFRPLGLMHPKNSPVLQPLLSVQRILSLFCGKFPCWEISQIGKLVVISNFDNPCSLGLSTQEKEFSYGLYLRLLKNIVGQPLNNCRIEFTHNNSEEIQIYKKSLKTNVTFNQECERIIIDACYLNLSTPNQNHTDTSIYQFNKFSRYKEIDIEQQVKKLILQNMLNKTHTIENIANRLDMHPRSLQRRLEEKNLNFKRILNDLRIDVACWHLKVSNKSVTLISGILGYNEVSSFSRTFRRHKNCSALQWRKNHTAIA